VALALVAGLTAIADSPSYSTVSQAHATLSKGYFVADPVLQPRVVGVVYTTDLVGAQLKFYAGTTAYTVSATNLNTTTLTISSTNGLTTSDTLIIQSAGGSITNIAISSFPQSTNITLANIPGFNTVPGDSVYKQSSATVWGAFTNVSYSMQGEALFVGGRGRPLMFTLNSTSTNTISASAHYDP
jgi:hypothetical protein